MVETKRLKLKGFDRLWHYSPSIFFLIVPLTDLYLILKSKFNNNIESYQRMVEGQKLAWIFLFIAIVLFFYKWINLRFKEVHLNVSEKSFNEALHKTTQQLDWNIIEQNNEYIVAKSHHSLGSWGEQITIIKQGNKVLINSICDPQARPAISSWGGNNKNMNRFIENLKNSGQH